MANDLVEVFSNLRLINKVNNIEYESRWWHGTAERRNWRKSEARVSLAKYWIVSFFL
jgi:hypothetical protein